MSFQIFLINSFENLNVLQNLKQVKNSFSLVENKNVLTLKSLKNLTGTFY